MQNQNKSIKFNEADKNARPYCVSLDWLSVSCRDQGFIFYDREEQASGYKLVKLEHGSKCFAYLANLYDPDGQLIGELHAMPYNKAMDRRAVIVKADNALLYQRDGVEQLFAAISSLALYYKGINRIDLACDQNEFYGGLLPVNLMKQYFDDTRPVLKLGCNHGISYFDLNYYGTASSNGLSAWSKMPIPDAKKRAAQQEAIHQRNEDLAKVGLPLLDESPAHAVEPSERICEQYQSVTWGTRGNGVQVQLYNKTKELQEKKLKHYIVDAWKAAGLDVSQNVYRVEIRIHGRGKGIVNTETGKAFEINLIDCILQEQIEDFFFAFAQRHFMFFRNKGKVKLRQNEPIKLWHRRPSILKPKLSKTRKDPSRFTLVLSNAIMKERNCLRAQADLEKEAIKKGIIDVDPALTERRVKALEAVSDYFREAYLLSEWEKERDIENKIREQAFLQPLPPQQRMAKAWSHSSVYEQIMHKIQQLTRPKYNRENHAYISYPELHRLENTAPPDLMAEAAKYDQAVETSFRTITYCEYVPKEDIPDEDSNEIDWDTFMNQTS